MVKRYDLSVDDWNEVKLLEEPNGEYVTYADYEELEDELKRVNSSREWWRELGNRVVSERDQALAQLAAAAADMRERAAETVQDWWERGKLSAYRLPQDYIRALPLSPDGQQLLNEMREEAWDDGRSSDQYDRNPYRKDEK